MTSVSSAGDSTKAPPTTTIVLFWIEFHKQFQALSTRLAKKAQALAAFLLKQFAVETSNKSGLDTVLNRRLNN